MAVNTIVKLQFLSFMHYRPMPFWYNTE